MQEAILIVIFIAILIGSHFLLRNIKQPYRSYIRIFMMIALIMLVWWPDENSKLYESALLSVLAISGIIGEYFSLMKFRSKIEH